MDITHSAAALKITVSFRLKTSLLIRSGYEGEFTDSAIEKTPEGKLHINGYVWASLMRRALMRLKGKEQLIERIGKVDASEGVSSLWCSSSVADLKLTDYRPGIRVDRRWGATAAGALYSDEIVPAGITVPFNSVFFCETAETAQQVAHDFLEALWVIHQGIEGIGGGWSYGLGLLELVSATSEILDIRTPHDRERLWRFTDPAPGANVTAEALSRTPEIDRPWVRYSVEAQVAPYQLFAVHSTTLLSDVYRQYPDLPDAFVFRCHRFEGETLRHEVVIPGKAIRQALFSVPIERQLRSEGEDICDNPSADCACSRCVEQRAGNRQVKRASNCGCLRCKWFGATDMGGIIAVTDAFVNDPERSILHRIQLCEHSMQNMNLFAMEYLTRGRFSFDIIIDTSKPGKAVSGLQTRIVSILEQMQPEGNAPPGWFRMGATAGCTGQLQVNRFTDKRFGG